MSVDGPSEIRLSLAWELWVVEQLLFTGKRDDLIDALVAQGVDRAQARAQVLRILASPAFERLRLRMGEGTLAARLQRLGRAVRGGGLTERVDVDRPTLLADHWIPGRPLKLTGAVDQVGAVQRWSLAWLAQTFPDASVQVNVDRGAAQRPRETERRAAIVALPELVRRIVHEPGDDFYVVSRNGLMSHPALAALWHDLSPLPAFLEPPERPRGVSLWIGPRGTITPAHFDPHNVLLVQVEGAKQITLAPPIRAEHHALLDGFYLDGELQEAFGDAVISVRLEPGEALFVPVAWFHRVEALSPSMTLSFLCFPWPNHFHWLGPPGADDRRGA